MSKELEQAVQTVTDNRNKLEVNAEKVRSVVRSVVGELIPGALEYFDVILHWKTGLDDSLRTCRVLLVKSEHQAEPRSLPNRRASLQLLSTVSVTPYSVIVQTFDGDLHAHKDREIESALTSAIKEQSVGNLATVQAAINQMSGKKARPGLRFDAEKFNTAIANAMAISTPRQDMYRAVVQAIDAIDAVLGPKRAGRLKACYVTTTDYRNHVVLALSWEPVESDSDWFRVCAVPTDTKPWVTKSYPLDVVDVQKANTVVHVKNRNDCLELVESTINSEPFMSWLAHHTLGTA